LSFAHIAAKHNVRPMTPMPQFDPEINVPAVAGFSRMDRQAICHTFKIVVLSHDEDYSGAVNKLANPLLR